MPGRQIKTYQVGNHGRAPLKDLPLGISMCHVETYLKILEEAKKSISDLATCCKPRPQKTKKVSDKNRITLQEKKGVDFLFSFKIYISGCNVYWLVICNAKTRNNYLKVLALQALSNLRKSKGYST